VVLDTNVYVSAFTFPRGVPRQVWRHALRWRYRLLVSPAIVREVARVLREDFHWEERRLRRRLKLLVRIGEMVTPQTPLYVITNDPDDNRIIELEPLLQKPYLHRTTVRGGVVKAHRLIESLRWIVVCPHL
jgi:predicted nucleic acid-binding protein